MGKEQSEYSVIRKAVNFVANRQFLRDHLGLDPDKIRRFKLPGISTDGKATIEDVKLSKKNHLKQRPGLPTISPKLDRDYFNL